MSIHFTAKTVNSKTGSLSLNWYKMGLKPDLIDALKSYGMLPKSKPSEIVELMKENVKLEKTIEKLQETI